MLDLEAHELWYRPVASVVNSRELSISRKDE